MNIVFWSPVKGHGASSSNMACIAMMSSFRYCYKTLSFQTGFDTYKNLLFADKYNEVDMVSEEFSHYMKRGLDGVFTDIHMESFTKESIGEYSEEIIKGLGYTLLPMKDTTRMLLKEKMKNYIEKLLTLCEQAYDITFIDIGTDIDEVSECIFKNAQVCVVNVSQNPELVMYAKTQLKQHGFDRKCIFVIGRYDSNSKYSEKAIAKKCGIKSEDIGVIPYSMDFFEASLNKKISHFIKQNISCGRKSGNYNFIFEVKRITERLLKKAGAFVAE